MTIDHDALRAAAADIAYPDLYAQGVWDMRGTNPTITPLKRPRRRPTTWKHKAACRHADPDIFFPETSSSTMYNEALAYCQGCKVRATCLAEHLDEKHGVFGGTTPLQRKQLRGKRRKETA